MKEWNPVCSSLGEYRRRIKSLQSTLEKKKIDVLMVTSLENVCYLSGVMPIRPDRYAPPPLMPLLIPLEGQPAFITTTGFYRNVKTDYETLKDVRFFTDRQPQFKVVKMALEEWKLSRGTVGIEKRHLSIFLYENLRQLLSDVRFVDASGIVEEMRMVKSPEEIECLRKASEITDKANDITINEYIKPGMTENDIGHCFIKAAYENGARDAWFPQILSGIRSTYSPSPRASDKPIRNGDLVILDWGVDLKDYATDICRMVSIGEPSDKYKKFYDIQRDAVKKTIEAIKPGISASKICEIGRRAFTDAGIPEQYVQLSVGHGLGLAVHEEPSLVLANRTIIKKGMVLSIEPNMIIPGKIGTRLEDNIVVTKDGVENLNKCSREMRIIR